MSNGSHGMDSLVARDEYPEETRSVCSISNHMEQLGRDNSMGDRTVIGAATEVVPDAEVSANTTGTSSTLDARIQALSDMNAEERCSQLNQDAVAQNSGDVPMDTDFLNCSDEDETTPNADPELHALLTEANARTGGAVDPEMPDLEGSEIDFETK